MAFIMQYIIIYLSEQKQRKIRKKVKKYEK